jgi:phospholipid/cholesterol/gamma-HCH transport system substrate-binding protein
MEPKRERVWVGLFVVVAVAVLSGTAVAVWGGLGRTGVPYRAYFKFSGGVQPGTTVRYGGLRVGSVRRVQVDPGNSTRIEVDLVVEPGTPIKVDSVARPSSLGPLSDNYIEISTGTELAALAPPGGILPSAEPFGIAQIGDTVQDLVPQIERVLDKLTLNLDSLQVTLGRADALLNEGNRANLSQALARANDLFNDGNRARLSESLDSVNQMLKESGPKVSSGLTRIDEAASRLTPLLDDVNRATTRADGLLTRLDSVLLENRADLRASVSELREMLSKSTTAVDQLQGLMNQNTANIDQILENMRLSAENIRTLTEAVKSNPSTLIRGVNARDRKPGDIRE